MYTELKEELNLSSTDLEAVPQALGMGIHMAPDSALAEVGYFARTPLTAKELLERANDAIDSWEGKHTAFTPQEVRQVLEEQLFHPTGALTLALAIDIC